MPQSRFVDLILSPGSVPTGQAFPCRALSNSSASELMSVCGDSTATFVGVGGLAGSLDAGGIDEAVRQIDAGASDAVLLPLQGYDWLELLTDVPAPIWTRLPHVADGALIVVRREHLVAAVSAPGPRHPIGAVPAQLADTGIRIRFLTPSPSNTTAAPLEPFVPPALVPDAWGQAAPDLEQHLEFDKRLLPAVQSGDDFIALRAGLLQIHDVMERSHSLAQSIEGGGRHGSGDYWHAIMHRREPDYGNSKYWFRHVGRHPIHTELAAYAAPVFEAEKGAEVARWRSRLQSSGCWDPIAFVDLCEAAGPNEDGLLGQLARRIQWLEMLLLLRSTSRDAFVAATAEA